MKRIKMQHGDLYNLDIGYYDFNRVKNADGVRGWRYVLDKPLTASQLAAVQRFRNVYIGGCHYRYAPEIKHTTLVIFDKCLAGAVK